jgi:hypothetical protein
LKKSPPAAVSGAQSFLRFPYSEIYPKETRYLPPKTLDLRPTNALCWEHGETAGAPHEPRIAAAQPQKPRSRKSRAAAKAAQPQKKRTSILFEG